MSQHTETAKKSLLFPLMVGAVGVVYGDIGTSPLYALKETFSGPHGLPPAAKQHSRHPLASLLGACDCGIAQVCAVYDARR